MVVRSQATKQSVRVDFAPPASQLIAIAPSPPLPPAVRLTLFLESHVSESGDDGSRTKAHQHACTTPAEANRQQNSQLISSADATPKQRQTETR